MRARFSAAIPPPRRTATKVRFPTATFPLRRHGDERATCRLKRDPLTKCERCREEAAGNWNYSTRVINTVAPLLDS